MSILRALLPLLLLSIVVGVHGAESEPALGEKEMLSLLDAMGGQDLQAGAVARRRLISASAQIEPVLRELAHQQDRSLASAAAKVLEMRKADAILVRGQKALPTSKAFHAVITFVLTRGENRMTSSTEVKFHADGKRMVADTVMVQGTERSTAHIVADGTTVWAETEVPNWPGQKIGFKQPQQAMEEGQLPNGADHPFKVFQHLRNDFVFYQLEEVQEEGRACLVLSGSIAPEKAEAMLESAGEDVRAQAKQAALVACFKKTRVCLDKTDGRFMRLESGIDPQGLRMTTTIDFIKTDVAWDDQLFKYTPSENVRWAEGEP
ncbi:MAG: hypothetical protein M5U26_29490 [Planctomycetota bacterium]|nr:hypothetical protein [Planctomycetota bacterium]